MRRRIIAALVAGTLLGACGGGVTPIRLNDPAVPLESRKLIADTQDTVSIARLARDAAARDLARAKATRKDLVEERLWPTAMRGAVDKLTALEDRRVELARGELELAESKLALANAKYTLLTAQTAMRHDLAVYDLEPLRDEVEAARARVEGNTSKVVRMRGEVDGLTSEWWAAYGSYAKDGGKTAMYHQSTADVPEFVPPPEEEAADEEEGTEDSTEAASEAEEAADALKDLAKEKKEGKEDKKK
jgi:hypothetical protein